MSHYYKGQQVLNLPPSSVHSVLRRIYARNPHTGEFVSIALPYTAPNFDTNTGLPYTDRNVGWSQAQKEQADRDNGRRLATLLSIGLILSILAYVTFAFSSCASVPLSLDAPVGTVAHPSHTPTDSERIETVMQFAATTGAVDYVVCADGAHVRDTFACAEHGGSRAILFRAQPSDQPSDTYACEDGTTTDDMLGCMSHGGVHEPER